MPIYEYRCDNCQDRFEVRQKFTDPPLTECIRCGKPVTKLISSPAIMFKGSGWYVTDYSDKLKPPAEPKPEGQPVNGGAEKSEKRGVSAATSSGTAPDSAKTTPSTSTTGSSQTGSKSTPV